jgi:ABC-2 type transport system ATP-binding protein
MISIEKLVVRYEGADEPAVRGLSLEVEAGGVFGLLGPNGAGKTTTLRVLAGLLAPSEGAVEVAGLDVRADPAAARRVVGYLPDDFGVYDDLTCREYLDFFAAAQGLDRRRREAIIEEVLALVDLGEKTDVLAGSLSRGMAQRLGLARVLVHEPQVLLLDEPASGLDPRARIEVREILRELARMGRTVVLSSHVLADIAQVCDSVGIVEAGRVVFAGSVREALHRAGRDRAVVHVGVAEGAGAARSAQEAAAGLGLHSLEAENGRIRVELPLDDDAGGDGLDAARRAAARVAATLAAAGLSLTHLAPERADLEGAFLELTEGRLA